MRRPATPRRDVSRFFAAFALRDSARQLFTPPASNFLPVDGVRALSILWVILMHTVWFQTPLMTRESAVSFLDRAPRWLVAGHYGVDVFFVISGFLIGFILMKEYEERGAIDVRRFYARRFLRLMPAYFASLAIYCLAVGVNCDMVWSNLIYVNNFVALTRQAMPWTWSLAIEEQFYLAFPLFLLLVFYRLRGWRIALLFSLLALGVLIRGAVIYRYGIHAPVSLAPGVADPGFVAWAEQLYVKPYTRYGSLLCGVIAAALLLRGSAARFFTGCGRVPAAGLVVALVAIGLVVVAPAHVSTARWPAVPSAVFLSAGHSVIGASVAYVLLYSLHPGDGLSRGVRRVLSLRLWYPVAQLSYSAYLLHPMVLGLGYGVLASYGLLGAPALLFYVLGPLLSLLAALVLYVVVERPFMNLRDAWRAGGIPARSGVRGAETPRRATGGIGTGTR
jgi:peptidoglycan/LPS O-acetylase OafA/YrhL